MAEEKQPATTQFGKKEDRTIELGGAPASAKKEENQKEITVRARRTFHQEANMKGDLVHDGDTFQTSRLRAAELRANGLVEYVSEGDEKTIHGEVDAEKIKTRIERDDESRKIPENAKTTPLRNPKVELAEVDESKTNKPTPGKSYR